MNPLILEMNRQEAERAELRRLKATRAVLLVIAAMGWLFALFCTITR